MAKSSPKVDHQALSDYIDGRLTAEERAELERVIATDETLARELAALSHLNEQIGKIGSEILDEPVPERLRQIVQPETRTKPQGPVLLLVLRRGAALGLAILVGFIAGYMTNDKPETDFSSLIEPFIEQALLSHKLFETSSYGTPNERIFISPESELADTSLHAPMRVPVSLGPDLQPVSLRTLTGVTGSAVQVAYLDAGNKLTSLLVREMSEEGEMPADFTAREEYQILFWIDGPLIYALVSESDEVALRGLAESIYSSNAIGGTWLTREGAPVQPAADQ